MNKLVALLPTATVQAAADRLHCWQVAADGSVQTLSLSVQDIARTPAAQLSVVVPVQAVSWHQVTLPAGVKPQGDARLQAVLHSLLEDALLDDAEHMHVALQPQPQAGQGTLVAACDKAWLGGWLEALERAGVQVGRIVPQAAPDMLQEFAVCTEHAHSAWLNTLLHGLPLSVPVNSDMAAVQAVAVCQALPNSFKEAADSLGADTARLWNESAYVQWMLATQWDLAQHSFASSTADRLRRKWAAGLQAVLYAPEWRAPRYAVIALAAVTVLGLHAQLWQQQRLLTSKQASVAQIAQTAFPHLQIVIDAPLQMQREVDALRHAAGLQSASDFQPLAAAAGAALQASGLAASAVEFSDGALLLRGLGGGDQPVQVLNQHLAKIHYVADAMGDAVRVRAMP